MVRLHIDVSVASGRLGQRVPRLIVYQSILDSGDPRIWRLAIDNEISNDEKERYLLNMIKKSGNIND